MTEYVVSASQVVERLQEIARRTERAHANVRLCHFDDWRGPGQSNTARRDAHLADLQLISGLDRDELRQALHEGRLVELFEGQSSLSERECYMCGKRGPALIAKHIPSEREVRVICRSEAGCTKRIKPVTAPPVAS